MYQVSSSTVFFFVSYIHIHVPFITYCSRLFTVVFQEMNCLHTFKHDVVCQVTELPSFMFVSAAVAEIHDLNQNKKKERRRRRILELAISNLTTFLGPIFYPEGTY